LDKLDSLEAQPHGATNPIRQVSGEEEDDDGYISGICTATESNMVVKRCVLGLVGVSDDTLIIEFSTVSSVGCFAQVVLALTASSGCMSKKADPCDDG